MRLLLLCLVLGWTTALQVGAQPAFPVALWLQGRDDAALKTRIEGQTADLTVALLPIVRDGQKLSPRERLAAAGGLLSETGARALLYWEPSPRGGRRLRVLSGDRVFSRELGGESAEEPARSATLESAAVIVRTVLRTLLAGEQTGVSLSEAVTETESEAAPRPPGVAQDQTQTPLRARRPGFVLSLGWQGTFDGHSPPGQQALSLSFGLTVSRLVIRLWGQGGLPVGIEDGVSRISLSRHGVALGVLGAAVQGERLRLHVGALVGMCGYYRTTDTVSAGYEATPPRFIPALCVSPRIELWLRPARRVPLYLELWAGAELVLGRPRLGYDEGGAFAPRGGPWPVQPALGLSLAYLFERTSVAPTDRAAGSPAAVR